MRNLIGKRPDLAILVLFFITGLTGLAYELVWIRLLILAFGSTQFAVTTVLVTFMSGLALGSLIFGRVVDRTNRPLLVYGLIELGLGAYCLASPMLFDAVRVVYSKTGSGLMDSGFDPLQFFLSFAVLIVPSTLMGGTLPALVKHMGERFGAGFASAVPYAVNTLGAVAGAIVTGFFAIYILGVTSTLYVAGAIDLSVGALILILATRGKTAEHGALLHEGAKARECASPAYPRGVLTVAAIVFTISGFCSLAYEVLWTRIFALILGSSVYAFTVMLATFLFGIGIGSAVAARYIDRIERPIFWFFALEAIIGIFCLASAFAYGELPFLFNWLKSAVGGWFWLFIALQFLVCALVMLIPTLCMGVIFPLVCRIFVGGSSTIGTRVGDVYFYNTSGSILGALVGGLVLVPYLGVQKGVLVVTALSVTIAVALLWVSEAQASFKRALTVCAALTFGALAFFAPEWKKTVMTLGLYANQVSDKELNSIRAGQYKDELIYYREGINAIVTVRRDPGGEGRLMYQANGKVEAIAENGNPPEAWSLLGHIPLLLHNGNPKAALLVGLGSGVTLGAMQAYPLERIKVVELETAVVEAARYFKKENDNALDDGRVKLHITDGRTFLFAEKETYDVIVSAVSDPWISGVSNLFTYEYFSELKSKLNDDGVVAMWFQNYRITPDDLKIGLNTFAAVFPHVSVWFHYSDTLDLIVIGSKTEHSFDMRRLDGAFSQERFNTAISRIGVDTPYDLMNTFLIGGDDLRRYIGDVGLNSDERPILEFSLPKNQYSDPTLGLKTVEEMLLAADDFMPPVALAHAEKEDFFFRLGQEYNEYAFRLDHAKMAFEQVLSINPGHREAKRLVELLNEERREAGMSTTAVP